ncbi:phage tail protein [Pseudarthrobacter sp. NIBRBAC000502772]|uniref:phage tail protein n=1 Tax=Pseudarthrobacter sp. NIBRBAC000502772 TaxID=2590775 RepID=UPI0011304AA1|nr:phage tail protein [Pseudarthrobacter sp. NIBRBAC000502772]QDG66672.1 phage tail protein [Pseudarthrobacter sp. NIBRBAC000502772]
MLPLASPTAMPFTTAHFVLAIDGLTSVSFSKCSGLAGEVSVEEYQEGGENRFAHRFPSRAAFPNLVLNQGAGPLYELWDWFYEFHVTGMVRPRDGTVVLMSTVDGELAPVRVWAFTRGWPVKLTGPDLDAQSSAVAIEAIEIAHHGLVLKKVL